MKEDKQRNEEIKKLFYSDISQVRIAEMFKISRQRVHQIATGYNSPSAKVHINPLKLKNLTSRKRMALGLGLTNLKNLNSSRDKVRELVRIRDNHTCLQCKKKWVEGNRRFDVHHLEESMDGQSRSQGIHKYDIKNMDKLITLCHKCHFNLDITKGKISKSRAK